MKPYEPKRGDLVLTPWQLPAVVTEWNATRVSVFLGNGFRASCDRNELVPFVTNEPRPGIANFDWLLKDKLESFAPGFRVVRSMPVESILIEQPTRVDRIVAQLAGEDAPPLDEDPRTRGLIETIADETEDPEVVAAAVDSIYKLLYVDTPGVDEADVQRLQEFARHLPEERRA